MHLSGFWPDQAYILAPPLNLTSIANAATAVPPPIEGKTAPLDDRGGLDAPLADRMERHCHKRGRARMLYADRPVLRLRRNSRAIMHAEAADDGGEMARSLLRRLVLLATLMGRLAVLPSFNCSSRWIRKSFSGDGFHYVNDINVAKCNEV